MDILDAITLIMMLDDRGALPHEGHQYFIDELHDDIHEGRKRSLTQEDIATLKGICRDAGMGWVDDWDGWPF